MKNNSVRNIAKLVTSSFKGMTNMKGGAIPKEFDEYPMEQYTQGVPPPMTGEPGMPPPMMGGPGMPPVTANTSAKPPGAAAGLQVLILGSLLLILISFIILYISEQQRAKKENRNMKGISEIFGFSGYTAKQGIVGMTTNVIFGFIDNAGLFFGMDALDPYMPSNNELVKAGFGNTFSDGLGSFVGTFIGTAVQNFTQVDDSPLYSQVIGIIIGCLLGVYIPKSIKGIK